ncbi:hypothetical protein AB0M48_06425 [Lentzea sp. NPDC051208]|uniref:hypothetical protein n=1 Tax=Lentzea sp. NPDC051208 TaxID=3154642 RepID=UPI0034303DB1
MAHLGVAGLADIAQAAYGRELRDVVRLHGGSKKGVYRLTLDDGTTGIAYVWRTSEDYWPEHEQDPLFGNASGRDLFLTAHTALSEAGACVPRLVLVDSEGVMFFDVEWEHVFLELRFGPHYRPVPGLDPARMSLYRLAQHLSLVEGPLRLLEGDFPHRDAMREIAEHNVGRVLTC